jgi:CubicO group peptidase (beta-lactamase class C family)
MTSSWSSPEMPTFRTIALLLVILSAGLSAGQRATPKPPAAAADGISRERLKRLDAVLQEHIEQNRIAGIVALVLRDGKPIYERALGGATRKRSAR